MESTDIQIPCLSSLGDSSYLPCNPPQTSTNKSCPWATSSTVVPVSFADVMSEQLIHSLVEKDEERLKSNQEKESKMELLTDEPDCSSDFLLAQMLQREYDLEQDAELERKEKKFNAGSKVSVSFKNYRRVPQNMISDDESTDEDLDETKQEDTFEIAERQSPIVGKNGISRQGNTITTKHDLVRCARRNAHRLMEFPPGIITGDGGGFDMQLSNHVYNKLKVHSISEGRRSHKLHDKKEKSTAEQAVDPKTCLILYKLVNREYLESISGCISRGKEACVFHAFGGQNSEKVIPSECAVKVFKTTLNEFKNRDQYIRDDYRFKERFNKQNSRHVIHMWAEKEMHNLNRMRKAGLLCPEVVILQKHVLVMSFIGSDSRPAPKLKDAKLSTSSLSDAYIQTIEIMKRMFKICNLVHADLSEYNLLWHKDQVWVIDVSQSVEPNHPQALEFLMRDCINVIEFFKKHFLPNIMTAKDLFKEICGISLPGEGAELLSQIQNYEKEEELLAHGKSDKTDSFEILFAKCQQQSNEKLQKDENPNRKQ
ncbi:serine/threonine-protein kinase RIO3-like [Centruroides sculpturatus]|uniref:serine/threonine-protein kinase RIO3-like n=1 Tax=Centruroides sculpturatus TaxID=218467 RepID=UPI000C6CEDE2|nr:serine/threonine-protein kinase RIO3-like [Centruroides sculpturatus]